MGKIMCDICGTKYPDTVEQCPICGYSNAAAAKTEVEDVVEEVVREARPKSKGGRFSKSNVSKNAEEKVVQTKEEPVDEFDLDLEDLKAFLGANPVPRVELDEPAPKKDEDEEDDEDEDEVADDDDDEDDDEDDEDEDDDDEDDEEEGGKSGTILNILLGIVIVALLCVSGYIFVKYFLPNMGKPAETVPPTTEAIVETQMPETEAPTVPCSALLLSESAIELNEIGQMYLLNVEVQPMDTTDTLMFMSGDDTIATVNEEGRVTAVGEGETVVTIACGEQRLEIVVTVAIPEPTEPPTEAPTDPTEPPTEPGVQKTVTNAFVNVRSGAGTQYDKVGEYKQGDVVTIYEETIVKGRPWGRTDLGWICTEYVE